jgi:hypothetical protein
LEEGFGSESGLLVAWPSVSGYVFGFERETELLKDWRCISRQTKRPP